MGYLQKIDPIKVSHLDKPTPLKVDKLAPLTQGIVALASHEQRSRQLAHDLAMGGREADFVNRGFRCSIHDYSVLRFQSLAIDFGKKVYKLSGLGAAGLTGPYTATLTALPELTSGSGRSRKELGGGRLFRRRLRLLQQRRNHTALHVRSTTKA